MDNGSLPWSGMGSGAEETGKETSPGEMSAEGEMSSDISTGIAPHECGVSGGLGRQLSEFRVGPSENPHRWKHFHPQGWYRLWVEDAGGKIYDGEWKKLG